MSHASEKDSTGSGSGESRCYLSGWHYEYRCTACHQGMNYREYRGSGAKCTTCGSTGAVYEVPYRIYRRGPWWRFWAKRYRHYGNTIDVNAEALADLGRRMEAARAWFDR